MTQLNNTYTNNTHTNEALDFLVIGAGISGLSFANKMQSLGVSIAVFEKARGTGGRISSKRVTNSQRQNMDFDLGCSSFVGHTKPFKAQLNQWHQDRVIEPWFKDDQDNLHYVAVSRNSALTRYLSNNLTCHFSTKIESIRKNNQLWEVSYINENGINHYVHAKNIILATPAPQACDLLPDEIKIKANIKGVSIAAQWVLAVELENESLNLTDLSFPNNDVIHSISIESNKPRRTHTRNTTILQIQASAPWSQNNIDTDKALVETSILKQLEQIIGQPVLALNSHLHRWLYSTVSRGLESQLPYIWHKPSTSALGLGIIGDYFNTEHLGIEASWYSATALAENLANGLATQSKHQAFNRVAEND